MKQRQEKKRRGENGRREAGGVCGCIEGEAFSVSIIIIVVIDTDQYD